MIKCTINGVPLEVKPGTTIIQAMMENGQRIAHYCWHPGLSIAGVCRLCMVEIEGNPRLQIACNTVITEGMKINNTSEKVKEAAKWGLEFHLINHPLDCPICDQAGECGLQDQYMEFGAYDSAMAEPKQKKHKVVDLGSKIVLDTERCILCSRCVRFTDEVSKTHELGIFNRGDRSEIGTHDGKKLENNYALNTVDICPVGALTSKDFRFRQRVWYLKNQETICNGCSTGCNVKVYFNKEGFFRVKPVYNPEVNGYWMCDEGREIYKFANREYRWDKAWHLTSQGKKEMAPAQAALAAAASLGADSYLVLTGQYTLEEYDRAISFWVQKTGNKNIFHWKNQPEEWEQFDGLLMRGDRNPNSRGLAQVLAKHGVNTHWEDLNKALAAGQVQHLVVAAPETAVWYKGFENDLDLFAKAQTVVWLQSFKHPAVSEVSHNNFMLIPMRSYVEKSGTFVNHAGREQKFDAVTVLLHETLTLDQAVGLMAGMKEVMLPQATTLVPMVETHRPVDRVMNETRKRNEFIFMRGRV